MTRARSTLTVLTDGPHAFVRMGDAVLPRRVTPDTNALPRTRLRYMPPDPRLVDLSFAGRVRPGDPSLAVILAARPGDPVHLIRWEIDDAQGQTLARLSRACVPPEGTTFLRGEVAAVLNWRREDGDEEYHHLLRRDEWEVVLPELVFESPSEPQARRPITPHGDRLICKALVFTWSCKRRARTLSQSHPKTTPSAGR